MAELQMVFSPVSKMKVAQTMIHADTWALLCNPHMSALSASYISIATHQLNVVRFTELFNRVTCKHEQCLTAESAWSMGLPFAPSFR